MNINGQKNIFRILAALTLVIMLIAGSGAGISCDEILHYDQSVNVLKYFATSGQDKSALNTPETNLKFYGQSYDNIITALTQFLGIDDVYTFRNIMSASMGWLAIVITALFAVWLRNYLTGIITLLLFLVSPTFFGHSLNNLKDIPFAFSYISGIWLILLITGKKGKLSLPVSIFLTLGIAFCISIRAGGLILIFYLFLFHGINYLVRYFEKQNPDTGEMVIKTAWFLMISLAAMMLGCLLWPFALQDPLNNIIASYKVMAHYPLTFRQIFEGRVEWSDFMPWYYLIKSMAVTIPIVILSGFLLFLLLHGKIRGTKSNINYLFLLFTIIFPIAFVIIEKSNLYSSWRQFLFVYPGFVILSATGLSAAIESVSNRYLKWSIISLFILASIHPARFMIKNHPYEYMYYNEIAGGFKGAYGNYEGDYYFTSQTEAAKWLSNYFEQNNLKSKVRVSATYSLKWLFRNNPNVETSWFRFEERSMFDWDYAIIVNRYITPFQLKNNIWPPKDVLQTIKVDDKPVCIIVKRDSKNDYLGYQAMQAWNYSDAERYFREAIKVNDTDEMIFYNFAAVLYKNGRRDEADSALKKCLALNPGFDLALMYAGNIALAEGRKDEARGYYEQVIESNRKYFDAYVSLSEIIGTSDVMAARKILRGCLRLNPGYKPAIKALGDTYRSSDPETAAKYYEKAKLIQ